eukprot:15549-Heterococcus_DN1.PRE.2
MSHRSDDTVEPCMLSNIAIKCTCLMQTVLGSDESLVFELYGTACKETHTFIKALTAQQVLSSGDGWAPSQCISRWRQRFTTVLQRQIFSVHAIAMAAYSSHTRSATSRCVGICSRQASEACASAASATTDSG